MVSKGAFQLAADDRGFDQNRVTLPRKYEFDFAPHFQREMVFETAAKKAQIANHDRLRPDRSLDRLRQADSLELPPIGRGHDLDGGKFYCLKCGWTPKNRRSSSRNDE